MHNFLSSPEFAGEKIPTLTEALDLCEELDMFLLLDVKSNRLKVRDVLTGLNCRDGLQQ